MPAPRSFEETAKSPKKPLARYTCHKEVRALKIKYVERVDGKYFLHFAEEGYEPIEVHANFIDRHGPTRGSYYVLYNDDYASVSPARAFEEGYTAVQE